MTPYEQGATDERARIVWWLRSVLDGPASVRTNRQYLAAVSDLGDVIENHPDRFADAPPSRLAEPVAPAPDDS